MNNISESFNAIILGAKDKSILTMCEWIKSCLMNRISTTATNFDRWEHMIMHILRKRLDKMVLLSGQWNPCWSMNNECEIKHAYNIQQIVVDVSKRTCTCRF